MSDSTLLGVPLLDPLYISKKIENEKDETKKKEIVKSIKYGSLMHHGHFSFGGEYDFSEEKMSDSVGLKAPKNKLIKDD